MLVVVDTNVFVTALLRGPTPRRIYDAFLRGEIVPVFSLQTLAELSDVLTRPALRMLTSHAEVAGLLQAIQRDGLLAKPVESLDVCRDRKDNRILECAVAGRVECIVTGDRDLLILHPFRRIPILRPAEFLRRLPTR